MPRCKLTGASGRHLQTANFATEVRGTCRVGSRVVRNRRAARCVNELLWALKPACICNEVLLYILSVCQKLQRHVYGRNINVGSGIRMPPTVRRVDCVT